MNTNAKIAVVGAGGVGGYFGGLLAKAGLDVFFLARGGHLKAIKENGLKVESYGGDFDVKVEASDDPAMIGLCDVVLFCVKSFDTKSMAERIRPLVGQSTVIISFQNGVENEEIIGNVLGSEKVMGGVAFIGSRIKAPGVILHTAAGSMIFGELEGGSLERGRALLKLFEDAGFEVALSENIKKAMWQKMVWNCGFNAITALSGSSVSQLLSVSEARQVVKDAMDEVLSVAKGLGVLLREDLPEKTIAHTEKQGEIRTSMLVDLENGRKVEIEALNGAVSRLGVKLGVPTPVNDTLYAALKVINKIRE